MSADILILPVKSVSVVLPTAKRLIEQYFRDENLPLEIDAENLNHVDRLLLWLWISGYRVMRIENEDER